MAKKSRKKAKRRSVQISRRGGTTTVTPGGFLKKQVYLTEAEWEALRKRAYLEDRTYSDIVREALRRYFKLKK